MFNRLVSQGESKWKRVTNTRGGNESNTLHAWNGTLCGVSLCVLSLGHRHPLWSKEMFVSRSTESIFGSDRSRGNPPQYARALSIDRLCRIVRKKTVLFIRQMFFMVKCSFRLWFIIIGRDWTTSGICFDLMSAQRCATNCRGKCFWVPSKHSGPLYILSLIQNYSFIRFLGFDDDRHSFSSEKAAPGAQYWLFLWHTRRDY